MFAPGGDAGELQNCLHPSIACFIGGLQFARHVERGLIVDGGFRGCITAGRDIPGAYRIWDRAVELAGGLVMMAEQPGTSINGVAELAFEYARDFSV